MITGDDAGEAQARLLLDELHGKLVEIAQALEQAELRCQRRAAGGLPRDRIERKRLRQELTEAHRHIATLNRRYPRAARAGAERQDPRTL